jgi:hypothetical protein
MIDFKNLIVGRHQTKVVFVWNPENGVSMLGTYRGIEDGIRAILAGNNPRAACYSRRVPRSRRQEQLGLHDSQAIARIT